MADLEKSVAIIFEGVDQMGAGVDSATKRMNSIIGSAQGVVDPIANATMGVLKFEAALIASGVAVTALSVKMAGDFDAQFREITTLINAPTETLSGFKEELLAYGRDSTQSFEAINSAVYNAISAGVDYTDSLELVRLAEQGAVAGRASVDESLGLLISSLNAYGVGTEQAANYSDLFFTTLQRGVTTLPELASSLGGVTGLAATAGVSIEELLAAVATLTATGSTTSGALTQIQAAISNLLKPSSQAADLASELGIEFNAAALESKGLSGVLQDVQQATGGNTEQMARLFGSVEALNGVLTLTGLGADRFAGNIEAMGNAAGATDEAYARMAGTVEQNNQRIVNAFQGLLISIGTPLLDEFGGIQQAIAAIFNSIGASVSSGQLQQFVGLIESVMGSLERSLQNVATNLPQALETADLGGYVRGFEAVRNAIAGLFNGADLSTAEGLASVIGTLGSGVQLLGEYTGGAITAFGPFIQTLAELAGWIAKIDPQWALWLGTIGGTAVVASTVLAGLSGLVTILQALGGTSGAIPTATNAAGGLVSVLGRFAGPAGAAYLAYEAISSLTDQVREFNKEPITLAEKIERDLSDVENITGREFSLFNLDNIAAGYESLRQYFGWGVEAEADFVQLSDAAVAAAIEVATAAKSIGGESAEDVKRISDAAIEAALAVASASNNIKTELDNADISFYERLSIGDLPESLERVQKLFQNSNDGIVASAEDVGRALNRLREAFESGEINQAEYDNLSKALLGLRDSSTAAAKGQEALSGEVLTSEDAILKAKQAVLDQTLALQQLASDERIRNLEISVDFQVAKMETEARRVEAILDATSTTIASTAEAAASMFDTLGGGSLSGSDRFRARDAIDQQLKIQKQAAEQQGRLIEAQIEGLTERTRALRNGEGLIKIESDGLEPALEMIMWQVLEKVQLRANAEGAEFLLGINGPSQP